MGIFRKKKEEERTVTEVSYEDTLLQALLGTDGITRAIVTQIPAITSAIDIIGNTIASTPIKLYEETDEKTNEVQDDRVFLLNDDTGDTLNANEFWRAIIRDYFLGKGGYAYINKERGKFKSLHYVEEVNVTITKNTDSIFKDFDLYVNGRLFKPYDFIKILRNSTDGASGTPITSELNKMLDVAYQTLVFEGNLVKKGGNKKGFLKSENKLSDDALETLKTAFAGLYSNEDAEKFVVLNKGIDFKESSSTSVELQLNENKRTNADELGWIFHISPKIMSGQANEQEISAFIKLAIMPLMQTIQCALNRDFLLEKEKKNRYWAFDTKELLKGATKERFEAYEKAIKNGVMTINEIRYAENLAPIEGMDVILMTLADVIYDINNKTYFTPNTKQLTTAEEVSE